MLCQELSASFVFTKHTLLKHPQFPSYSQDRVTISDTAYAEVVPTTDCIAYVAFIWKFRHDQPYKKAAVFQQMWAAINCNPEALNRGKRPGILALSQFERFEMYNNRLCGFYTTDKNGQRRPRPFGFQPFND